MPKRVPNDPDRVPAKPEYWNVMLWVLIALIAVLIGGWTIWATWQPNIRSLWAPE